MLTEITEIEKLASIVETLLFVSDRPLTLQRLKEIIDVQDVELLKQAINRLQESYKESLRGINLHEVAGGYQLRTLPENGNWVLIMSQARPQRLSRAALESLAIVAYKQPITRPEVEAIRGVDCGGVLKTLLEKDLVKIMGKKDEPGTPLIYGTTETFLSFFGIKSLRDLPSLKEYNDLREANETIPLEAFAQAMENGTAAVEATEAATDEPIASTELS